MNTGWTPVTAKSGKNIDGLTMHLLYESARGAFQIENSDGGYRVVYNLLGDTLYVLLWSS
jgi:hypothetical protein